MMTRKQKRVTTVLILANAAMGLISAYFLRTTGMMSQYLALIGLLKLAEAYQLNFDPIPVEATDEQLDYIQETSQPIMKVNIQEGDRVGAILSTKTIDGVMTVTLLGYGTYRGRRVPHDDRVGLFGISLKAENHPNPCIELDNGDLVYGCECFWGSEDTIRQTIDAWVKELDAVVITDYDIESYRLSRP
jgi:hypothetical protein